MVLMIDIDFVSQTTTRTFAKKIIEDDKERANGKE